MTDAQLLEYIGAVVTIRFFAGSNTDPPQQTGTLKRYNDRGVWHWGVAGWRSSRPAKDIATIRHEAP